MDGEQTYMFCPDLISDKKITAVCLMPKWYHNGFVLGFGSQPATSTVILIKVFDRDENTFIVVMRIMFATNPFAFI